MNSIYVSIKRDNLDFAPLMNKVDTISALKKIKEQRANGIRYLEYFANRKYNPKLKITDDGFYMGSCNCNDFIMRKKKNGGFCKHILAIIDEVNQEE